MTDSQRNILIIDDETCLLKSLVAFFEDEGFTVRWAVSGEDGLEILKFELMDAVIVDMRLPGIDGNETVVKAHALQPSLQFLIHTGSTDYQLPPPLRELGIMPEAVFLKPLTDLSILTQAVREASRKTSPHGLL